MNNSSLRNMASRPNYQIYEDCYRGYPQWRADPGPIEDSIIEIGDVGYCSEGKFKKIMHLNLREVCAGHDGIEISELRFPGKIFYQLTRDLRVRGGAEVGSGYTGLPVGGGATAGVQNHFHEASVLRLEDERAVYSYLDKRSTENIAKYALKHYQSWLTLESFRGVSVEEIVVIMGTYMTKNWKAKTFISQSNQVNAGANVNVAALLTSHLDVGRSVSSWTNPGFSCGHLHRNTPSRATDGNNNSYFRFCCASCDPPPQNQSVFLRTGRIREPLLLLKLVFPLFVGIDTVIPGGPSFSNQKLCNISKAEDSSDKERQNEPKNDLQLVDVVTTDVGYCAFLYDEVAGEKFKMISEGDAVFVTDDDVIRYLGVDPYADKKPPVLQYPQTLDKMMEPTTSVQPVADSHSLHAEETQEFPHEITQIMKSNQKQTPVSASTCCHPCPGKKPRCPIASAEYNEKLFALIIGINNYQGMKKLRGCVADSENVCSFLTETLRANPLHIIHLRDEEATRDGILSAFKKHFLDNGQIRQNDTIIFYFAGHGSVEFLEKAPSKIGGEDMETICPYDDRVAGVRGIPDRTLACLMRQLASIKGNNITAIYDSCHSGGLGREPSDLENSRIGIPPPSLPFPKGLDKEIWECTDRLPKNPHLPHAVLNSHILLAACQRGEIAYEERTGRGRFTNLLLKILREPERSLAKTTYIGLVHTMERPDNKPQIPKQTPCVEGNNKTRILFSMKDAGHCFLVSLIENGKFSVPVGTIHGVDKETEFAITSGRKRFDRLKPIEVLPLRSIFKKLDGIGNDSTAEITKWNKMFLVRRFPVSSIENGKFSVPAGTNDGVDKDTEFTIASGRKCFYRLKPIYVLPSTSIFKILDGMSLTDGSTADIRPSDSLDYDVIHSQFADGSVKLERRDGLIPCYSEREVQFTQQEASTLIDTVTHFNFHLLHQSTSNDIGHKLHVKLEQLSESASGDRFPVKNGKNFLTSNKRLKPNNNIKKGPKVTAAVELEMDDLNHLFGFTLSVEDYRRPLFPYIFGFDPITYQIGSFYHPEEETEGPLCVGSDVSIGYGEDIKGALKFHPDDVTFFKIFVTTKYVDLKGLVQEPCRLPDLVPPTLTDFWESWIYVVKTPKSRINK
ncbi:hypothetical protein BYT27DRAFT_7161421 [Phlegmacium glaucopus]|nr:hypothetical protein BYT27DRAFT_7161421 [Phlegmacium glaucopus]